MWISGRVSFPMFSYLEGTKQTPNFGYIFAMIDNSRHLDVSVQYSLLTKLARLRLCS